jgi:serine/threonine protein kinase
VASAGERFGAYTLVRYQGAKPTGEVWSAKSESGATVLVHVAPIGHRREDEVRQKIEDKLAIAKAVVHDNVVRVLDGGFERGQRFIATEALEGIELQRILHAAKRSNVWPSPGVGGYIVHEIARALAFAHGLKGVAGRSRRVIHGDVAPRTIFVERSGAVKLSEFVGPLEAQELIKTAGQEESGLLAYLSPELASSGRADPPADVFALGAVLWELLVGRPLFARTTDLETLEAVKSAELPEMPSTVPQDLASIARACLAKDPAERPLADAIGTRLANAILGYPDASPASARPWVERGFQDRDRISDPPAPAPGSPRKTWLVDSDHTAIGDLAREKRADAHTVPSEPPLMGDHGSTDKEVPRDPTQPSPSDPFYDPRRDGLDWHGGRFEVLERLGSGGMGEVYRVRDRELDEIVALKIIPKESTLELRSTERLKREVRLARKIASPYVCRIYDIVDLGSGLRGLTMSLVHGTTLSDLMRGGVPVDYKRFARWGADIADGLGAAHELSIIHRDLKPENVMIRSDDHAVILDFGIAFSAETSIAGASMKLTQVGMIMGTPLYMSPEQILNMPLDGRSDLFALGLMLAELITGDVPMKGANYAELLEKRVTKVELYHLKSVDPGVPTEFAEIVDALLRIATDDRPRSALDIAKQLRAFGEGKARTDQPSKPSSTPAALPLIAASEPPNDGAIGSALSPSVPPPASVTRGQPRALVGIALIALVLVVLGVMLAESQKRLPAIEETQIVPPDAGPKLEAIALPDAAPLVLTPPPDAGLVRDAGKQRGEPRLPPVEQM